VPFCASLDTRPPDVPRTRTRVQRASLPRSPYPSVDRVILFWLLLCSYVAWVRTPRDNSFTRLRAVRRSLHSIVRVLPVAFAVHLRSDRRALLRTFVYRTRVCSRCTVHCDRRAVGGIPCCYWYAVEGAGTFRSNVLPLRCVYVCSPHSRFERFAARVYCCVHNFRHAIRGSRTDHALVGAPLRSKCLPHAVHARSLHGAVAFASIRSGPVERGTYFPGGYRWVRHTNSGAAFTLRSIYAFPHLPPRYVAFTFGTHSYRGPFTIVTYHWIAFYAFSSYRLLGCAFDFVPLPAAPLPFTSRAGGYRRSVCVDVVVLRTARLPGSVAYVCVLLRAGCHFTEHHTLPLVLTAARSVALPFTAHLLRVLPLPHLLDCVLPRFRTCRCDFTLRVNTRHATRYCCAPFVCRLFVPLTFCGALVMPLDFRLRSFYLPAFCAAPLLRCTLR